MKSRAIPFSAEAIPVLADIHGDFRAFERVVAEIDDLGLVQPPLLLGDLLWSLDRTAEPDRVLDLVMRHRWLALVRGNTDARTVDGNMATIAHAESELL